MKHTLVSLPKHSSPSMGKTSQAHFFFFFYKSINEKNRFKIELPITRLTSKCIFSHAIMRTPLIYNLHINRQRLFASQVFGQKQMLRSCSAKHEIETLVQGVEVKGKIAFIWWFQT